MNVYRVGDTWSSPDAAAGDWIGMVESVYRHGAMLRLSSPKHMFGFLVTLSLDNEEWSRLETGAPAVDDYAACKAYAASNGYVWKDA